MIKKPKKPSKTTPKEGPKITVTPPEEKPDRPDIVTEVMTFLAYTEGEPEMSRGFGILARYLNETLPYSFSKMTAIRKLLESKEAAIRAVTLYKQELEKKKWVVKFEDLNKEERKP
jgi:hypothetical protein